MVSTQVIKVTPALAVMTPMALATFSHDMFNMCSGYASDTKAFISKPYLYCVSIELGLKAAILAVDCNDESKKLIKSLGHNLISTYNCFKEHYETDLFDNSDITTIEMINPYFRKKGLEYFTPEVLMAMMRGFKDLPSLKLLHQAAAKVDAFTQKNDLFVEANSSVKPNRGIIAFV